VSSRSPGLWKGRLKLSAGKENPSQPSGQGWEQWNSPFLDARASKKMPGQAAKLSLNAAEPEGRVQSCRMLGKRKGVDLALFAEGRCQG